jgi:hypothetical protein
MAKGPPYQLPTDVADFAARYHDLLSAAVAARMRRVGVPPDMIGIRYWGVDDGAFVRYDPPQLGGNIRRGLDGKPGINVDAAVLDGSALKVGALPAWRAGNLKDRVDAVTAHEYTEVLAPPVGDAHEFAVGRAEFTPLAITDRARQILREYRETEGL